MPFVPFVAKVWSSLFIHIFSNHSRADPRAKWRPQMYQFFPRQHVCLCDCHCLRKRNSAWLISQWSWLVCWNLINRQRRKHGTKSIRCISYILVGFSMNLAPWYCSCDLRPSLRSLCGSLQKRTSECAWTARRRKHMLFELGAEQTQTVHGSQCETEGSTDDALTLHTLPAV